MPAGSEPTTLTCDPVLLSSAGPFIATAAAAPVEAREGVGASVEGGVAPKYVWANGVAPARLEPGKKEEPDTPCTAAAAAAEAEEEEEEGETKGGDAGPKLWLRLC